MTEEKGYLGLLFGSFFRWWWALITGFASILSYLLVPPNGIYLERVLLASLTLIGLTLFFLCVSSIYQGWLIYRNRLQSPKVVGFQRSDIYSGEFVFLVEGLNASLQGKIAELRRFVSGIEVGFSLIELMGHNAKGQLQARPIWISPGHLRELQMHKFLLSDIIVDPFIQLRTVWNARERLIELRGQNETGT